ncbi:MAG: secretion protein HlyD [Verrucomicrobiae bacterium]|nr:secretion protein HlyD [Verrucomicrobiae bacterium]
MKLRILVLVALVVAATTGWHFFEKYRSENGPVILYGNVDIRGVDLGFRVGGRVSELLVDEGSSVKAGELIARLDEEPFLRELDQARANLEVARANERLKKAGYRKEDIQQARAQLEQAEAVAANSQRSFDRQARLLKTEGTSRQSYEDAETSLEEAKARVEVARASLAQMEAGFREEEIAAAIASTKQAEAAVSLSEIRLSDAELKSPSDGLVITRAVEAGAVVQQGATVLSLSLEDPVWVRAYVHEPQLGRFPPGTKVLLTTDSRPERPYHGRVGFVSPRAEFTPKSVETSELRTSLVYRLRIVVEDSDGGLRQGMPVTILLNHEPVHE